MNIHIRIQGPNQDDVEFIIDPDAIRDALASMRVDADALALAIEDDLAQEGA